jgi:hypothetical protein
MDNKQLVKNLLNEVWGKLNEDKIPEFYHPDLVAYFGKQIVTYKDIVNRLRYVKNNYLSVNNEIEDMVVEDNKVVVRLKQTYISNNKLENKTYQIIGVYKVTNGKVSELRALADEQFNYYQS